MSYAGYLRDLLRPLGVYDLEGKINGASLEVKGAALDAIQEVLEEIGRETDLTSAQEWGLEAWRELFDPMPARVDTQRLRQALGALLRIGNGPCTLETIRNTLSGCGLTTQVQEIGTGMVEVCFPGTAGIPQDFAELCRSIEGILPAHVEVRYVFFYLTWKVMESRGWRFRDVNEMTWEQMEKAI